MLCRVLCHTSCRTPYVMSYVESYVTSYVALHVVSYVMSYVTSYVMSRIVCHVVRRTSCRTSCHTSCLTLFAAHPSRVRLRLARRDQSFQLLPQGGSTVWRGGRQVPIKQAPRVQTEFGNDRLGGIVLFWQQHVEVVQAYVVSRLK